jgi:hypothetical protein
MGKSIDESSIRLHRVKDTALEEKLGRLTA